MIKHKISIICPSWDNVDFLGLTIKSIRKHTTTPYEILVHANECSLAMQKYAEQENFEVFTSSTSNLGVAKPVNALVRQATGDIIIYLGDDIYVAPGWDTALLAKFDATIHYQYLTAPMFEPQYANVCMNSPMNYGRTPETFQEELFLAEWEDKRKITQDIVSPWGPPMMSKELWDEIGGFDEGYFPGFGTDPDIVAKIYFAAKKAGKPFEFRGVTDSGMYHFQCISTDRLPNNAALRAHAKLFFIQKCGMEPSQLHKELKEVNLI